MERKVLQYIREHDLMRAGDRVGVAVSGGADSVALLRVLLELRSELGVVLSVVHFNHKIRGPEAEADEEFVGKLAEKYRLEFLCTSGDVPRYAESKGIGLEAAGREMRYDYFRSLLGESVDVVATAHTADDQAETVLMRVIRGAGTKGLAGIHPVQWVKKSRSLPARAVRDDTGSAKWAIVRPMLAVRRKEVDTYLRELGQEWREDLSNRDQRHLRNRVRHTLLPLLEREFNPAVVEVLSDLAEVARGEEEYWAAELQRVTQREVLESMECGRLKQLPIAVQRRVIREAAERAGCSLEFQHVEQVRKLVSAEVGKKVELPQGWSAKRERDAIRLLAESRAGDRPDYEHRLEVPGEVRIPELGSVIRAFFVPRQESRSGYNPQHAWDPRKLAPELVIRNWRAGDRFRPAHTKSEKKLKELLQERRVPAGERSRWPVAVSGGTIVWVRGFPPAQGCAAGPGCERALAIEEIAEDQS